MEKEEGKCCYCRNFERYYTKGAKRFNKTKTGLCRKKQEQVTAQDGCKEFVKRPLKRRSARLLRYYLNEILLELHALREVAEDDRDEITNE